VERPAVGDGFLAQPENACAMRAWELEFGLH
jgi:hypothetical protein